MDGQIIIGTKLDTKQLDKELKEETKQLSKYEKENEVLIKARVRLEKSKAMQEYQKLRQEIERRYGEQIDLTYTGSDQEAEARVRAKLMAKQKEEIQQLNEAYAEQFNELKKINYKIEENNMQQEISKKNIDEINEKLTKSRGYDKIRNAINNINKGTEGVLKKVARWGLAIFSIRSVYMLIRQSISTLSQYNEKLAQDIQGIRLAIANALAPVVEWIINLAKKLIGYLAYIIRAWTGRDIFKETNKSLNKANKNAKQLQKTLAGFDEMNVLQDNKSSSGDAGTKATQFEIPDSVPKWVDMIAKTPLPILAGILAFLVKAVPLITKFGLKLGLIKALGIGVLVAGIVKGIQDVIKYLNDPSWSNFADILIDIGIILAGIALIFVSWPVAIAAAIVLILGIIAKFWDNIKEFLTNIKTNVIKLGEDIKKWLTDHLGILGTIIGGAVDIFVGVISGAIDLIIHFFEGLFKSIKGIIDGIIKICKGDLKGGLEGIFKGIANVIITVLNKIIDGLNIIFTPLRAIILVAGKVLGKDWTMDDIKIPNVAYLAKGGIVHSPGKGIMMGNYVAGEGASPEAVLPLNDETLDRLGEKIAKHMSINADIKNYMNGRLISRELQKINNESEFAYNG